MNESKVLSLRQKDEIDDPLTDILRAGAKRLVQQAVDAEFAAFLAAYAELELPDGRRRVVRHGHDPVRPIQTGIGPVEVAKPKARDRGAATADERIRYASLILPKWARRIRRRAISRVETLAENFGRIISRAWRIATLSAGIGRSFGLPKARSKQASGDRHRCTRYPRAGLSRYGGRHHLVMTGGIIPLRRARSSRYGGRLRSECLRVQIGPATWTGGAARPRDRGVELDGLP